MTAKNEQFDAKSARTRQPLPLWAGAFDRATKEHTPEVIGAYMLILMAMWESKSCDLPSDDKHLAWVVKVSPTVWRRKFAPIIMPMLIEENSRIFSKKLQENAAKTEDFCRKQHERKLPKSEPKPLKTKDQASTTDKPTDNTTDNTTDISPENPKQLTINIYKEEEDARETSSISEAKAPPGLLADIREAVGVVGAVSAYWADDALTAHVEAWRAEGLNDDQIITEAKNSRAKNPDPPDGPKALDRWMQAAAKAKRNAPQPGQAKAATRAEVKPPPSPQERLKFFAEWVNGEKPLPPSTINNTLAHSLLDAGLVTIERLKSRGVAA